MPFSITENLLGLIATYIRKGLITREQVIEILDKQLREPPPPAGMGRENHRSVSHYPSRAA